MGQAGCRSAVSAWPRKERRANLARWLARCDGNLLVTSYRLGIHRSHIYRLVSEFELWPVVNELRRRKIERDHEARKQRYRGGMYV